MADLLVGGYLNYHQNIIITGATGGGKTYVAYALAEQTCRQGMRVRYWRLPRLNEHLHIGHADGSYTKQLAQIAKQELLILDDWGLEKLNVKQATDLLEVVEDRHGVSSTIICSQLPVEQWHSMISNGTVADALLDRLIHNAHRLTLSGESNNPLVLITQGAKGALVINAGSQELIAGKAVKPTDTTGAGDAFVGGLMLENAVLRT